MVRSTYTGISGVDPLLIEAAEGNGFYTQADFNQGATAPCLSSYDGRFP